MHLLDANVLIALGDSNHVHHGRVQQWFHAQPGRAWATCPLTENAFLRIVGASSYPSSPGGSRCGSDALEPDVFFPWSPILAR
jgi:predicted nucleic acid-binding protein